MLCRQLLIPAAVLAMVLAPPWGHPRALGGTYTWSPIAGYGYYITYPDNQFIPFNTRSGEVTVGYDPDNLDASYIDVSTGSPGYSDSDPYDFSVSVSADGVTLTAADGSGGSACVFLGGNPGPLDAQGDPESLNSLLGPCMSVGANGGFHNELFFSGQSVPEPSSLLTLALGIGEVTLAYAARRMRKRPWWRGLAGPSMILARASRRSLTVLPKESGHGLPHLAS